MTNKEAIEILKEYKLILVNVDTDKADEDIKAYDLAINALEERPQGKWIYDNTQGSIIDCYRCSNCGVLSAIQFYNYCPDCGAYMKEGK